MAQFELLLPKMGESVAEATIVKWLKNPGDQISEDEAVVEIATDKVDSDVPSPVSGKLVSRLVHKDDVVSIGSVIAIIETEGGSTAGHSTSVPAEPEIKKQEPVNLSDIPNIPKIPGITELNAVNEAPSKQAPQQASDSKISSIRFYSPLVRSIANEEGISQKELDAIKGTGAEGRVTKEDVLNYVQNRPAAGTGNTTAAQAQAQVQAQSQATASVERSAPQEAYQSKPAAHTQPSVSIGPGDEIIEMDRMRRLIADHMIMSKEVAVHVTSFVEADVTNLVKWRDKIKGPFEKREGEKITFTPVFVQAVTKAIKDFPLINVSVSGSQIIKKRDINIGMAAALPSGNLIVPVIKNADQLNLVGLTKAVNDLARRARANKLQPDEVKDGTFTITNIGPFGNIMGTPMINQPQVAILAIGTIQKKPAVIETEYGDVIAIRHKMYLSMSYDHRVVDGALGGMFLKRVADYLEGWDGSCEI
ncbi:dihydrolipoamide acetyltransferase family protein [Desertivirga xinjiangensis]|uniref:dihydrolipoamide acetyltransferase family protein n=1 Tax=Desertivirga xinjiangensis TaxID=539206 RepID=UPI00210B7E09|nr:dihydrolipoamide acetyltransferase family protein [Pedobacter xinjiangensis]